MRHLLTLALFGLSSLLGAQTLTWTWAWGAGGNGGEFATTDVSPDGGLFLLGNYEDTIDAHGVTLVSAGQHDLFVQLLDRTDGSVTWTAEAHNTADMVVSDIAYRSTGEIVVCGYVYHDGNPATFGPYTLPGDAFGYQAFVAGLSAAGDWNWLTAVPGPTTLSTQGTLVEVDASDDIFLQCGIERAEVHKYTGAGVHLWSTTASSDMGSLDAYAMDVQPDGGLVLTGRFHHTATFGSIQLTDPTNYYDAFIAKLDGGGNWGWAVQAGGSHWDKGFGVQATPTGDVYVLGTFRNTATFGPFTATAASSNDLWAAKLSGTGQWLWANPAGATTSMEVYGMDLADDGSRMVCTGTYAFAGVSLDGHTLPAPTGFGNDAYVAELDTLGNFISAKGFGSAWGDQGLGVAYDALGHIYAAGTFQADMLLDTFLLDNVYNNDLYIGRLDDVLSTAIDTIPAVAAPLSVYVALDQLVISNPQGLVGELEIFDALGRMLDRRSVTGADLQRVALHQGLPHVLCWRVRAPNGQVVHGAVAH